MAAFGRAGRKSAMTLPIAASSLNQGTSTAILALNGTQSARTRGVNGVHAAGRRSIVSNMLDIPVSVSVARTQDGPGGAPNDRQIKTHRPAGDVLEVAVDPMQQLLFCIR